MALLWGVVGYALYVYIILVLARIVLDWTRQFAELFTDNLQRWLAGRPLRNVYDRTAGY